RYFMVANVDFHLVDFLVPVVVMIVVLVVLHLLIALLLPLHWSNIRGEFRRQLEQRLEEELARTYAAIPVTVADALKMERRQVELYLRELGEVAAWLEQREKSASIAGLYGKAKDG